jgi:hypothetical protein
MFGSEGKVKQVTVTFVARDGAEVRWEFPYGVEGTLDVVPEYDTLGVKGAKVLLQFVATHDPDSTFRGLTRWTILKQPTST